MVHVVCMVMTSNLYPHKSTTSSSRQRGSAGPWVCGCIAPGAPPPEGHPAGPPDRVRPPPRPSPSPRRHSTPGQPGAPPRSPGTASQAPAAEQHLTSDAAGTTQSPASMQSPSTKRTGRSRAAGRQKPTGYCAERAGIPRGGPPIRLGGLWAARGRRTGLLVRRVRH